jgi:hypothetical protein
VEPIKSDWRQSYVRLRRKKAASKWFCVVQKHHKQPGVLYQAEWEICNDYGESQKEDSVNISMEHYHHRRSQSRRLPTPKYKRCARVKQTQIFEAGERVENCSARRRDVSSTTKRRCEEQQITCRHVCFVSHSWRRLFSPPLRNVSGKWRTLITQKKTNLDNLWPDEAKRKALESMSVSSHPADKEATRLMEKETLKRILARTITCATSKAVYTQD